MQIIGICGKMGAGKDTVANHLTKNHGFKKIVMADFIVEELKRKGIEVNRKTIQDLSKEYKNKYGADIWARKSIEYAEKNGFEKIVISGLRAFKEVETFRKKNNFTLLCVRTNPEIRFARLIERGSLKDAKDIETLRKQEEREAEIYDIYNSFEQISDFLIDNNNDFQKLYEDIDKIILNNLIVPAKQNK